MLLKINTGFLGNKVVDFKIRVHSSIFLASFNPRLGFITPSMRGMF